MAGLIVGGLTLVGTLVGFNFKSTYTLVLFLALAAGALVYVINEMLHVSRRINHKIALGWGLVLGFTAEYGTDLVLTYVGA